MNAAAWQERLDAVVDKAEADLRASAARGRANIRARIAQGNPPTLDEMRRYAHARRLRYGIRDLRAREALEWREGRGRYTPTPRPEVDAALADAFGEREAAS